MVTVDHDLLVLVKRHEGFRARPYHDSRGYITVGYGFCLDTWPMTEAEAEVILEMRLRDVIYELSEQPWWETLTDRQQRALVDLAYNIGVHGLLRFHEMIAAIEAKDWDRAAAAMLNSAWARQVGSRAEDDAAMLRYIGGETK
jgi:lysozyme